MLLWTTGKLFPASGGNGSKAGPFPASRDLSCPWWTRPFCDSRKTLIPRLFHAGLMEKQRQNVKWHHLNAVGRSLSCYRDTLPFKGITLVLQQRLGLENFICDHSHIIFKKKFLIFCWKGRNKSPWTATSMEWWLRQLCFCCLVRCSEPMCQSDSSLCSCSEITASQTRLLKLTCTLHKDNRWKFWCRATAKNKNMFQREKELVFLCLNLWSSLTSEGKSRPFAEDTWFCICENTAV